VRIDKDEVLVDIGYKSEGVIPVNELSIRKSVEPSDEVSSARRSTRSSSPRRTPTGA
jgi:ribosomal protein S1